jgi:hypothetical protein
MDLPSLIENGVSPKLNFGSLVGLYSFWWRMSTWTLVVVVMDLWKTHRYVHITWYGRPYYIFSQALVFPPVNILHKNFVEGRYDRTSTFGRITKNLENYFSDPCLLTKCNDENKFEVYTCLMHKIKGLKGKYEIIAGLPLGEGSLFGVRERDSSGCPIGLGLVRSRGGRLWRCSLHTFFVFFGGDEVGEALAGVFLISVFFFPLSLVDWLRLLGLVVPVECFVLF